MLAKEGLLRGETLAIDATTLEANAALRSIVRRDTGESYQQFLERLAKASGIATPTRQDLARIDRDRGGKGSNDDWQHPHDPEARITKMKDGRTHLAHKAEHVVDLDTGAIVAVTIQPSTAATPPAAWRPLQEAMDVIADVCEDADAAAAMGSSIFAELVADKGYHSNEVLDSPGRAWHSHVHLRAQARQTPLARQRAGSGGGLRQSATHAR